jgi:hypothetical protein
MAAKVYVVNAAWDEAAQVWVATSEDVPGLVAEAATFEELDREVRALVPELLVLNGVIKDAPQTVPVELIARRTEKVLVA